jgi:phosphoenolpyruvate synthase/pyruvate phosphate dikinase
MNEYIKKLSAVRASDLSLVGAKASVLGELLFMGVPVPDGHIITTKAISHWRQEHQWPEEVTTFISSLEESVAVRSSSVVEEGSQFSGVFETILRVTPREVLQAIEQVARSAHSERAAAAYKAANIDPESAAIAVLIQPMQSALFSGVLLSRDFERPDQVRVELMSGTSEALVNGQVHPARLHVQRDTSAVSSSSNPKQKEAQQLLLQDPNHIKHLLKVALQIESISGGATVEVEWVFTSGAQPLQVLQARKQPKLDEDRGLFVWDRGHNPMPLSEAQAAAARMLDQRARIPFRLKVLDGYLFVAPRPNATITGPKLSPDFVDFFEEEICAKILGPIMETPKDLSDALRRYVMFCEEYFSGILSGPRQVLDELRLFLSSKGVLRGGERYPEGLPTDPVAALMAGTRTKNFRKDAALYNIAIAAKNNPAATRVVSSFASNTNTNEQDPEARRVQQVWQDFMGMYGEESSAWDVCQKTYREDPTPLLEMIASFQREDVTAPEARRRQAARESANIARILSEALPESDRAIFADKLSFARLLFPLLEEDDPLFSKAQSYLRNALLAAGKKAGLSNPEDACWIDPNDLLAKLPAKVLEERAKQNRMLAQSRAARPPQPPVKPGQKILQGEGASGGVATGKVKVLRDLAQARLTPGEILVVPALLPTVSHLLFFAAGIIAEQGGTLSHAASMAREYNIPAVVGVSGATQILHDGETITIDGKTGIISRTE